MIHEGNGAFCHPPIKISENTEPLILGQLTESQNRKIALDVKLDKLCRIIVTDDGFFCIIMNITALEKEKLLNVIFATLTTKVSQAYHVFLSDDYASFKFEDGNDFVRVGAVRTVSFRNLMEFERDDENTFDRWKQMPRKQLTKTSLMETLERAYEFYKNPEFTDDIILIGQAWSLSYDGMESASFLYSWMIIENMLERAWSTHVDSIQRTGKEKEFLKSHQWYASHIIQGLSFANKVDAITRQTLNKLRQIRNDIVHNRHQITKDESYDCMNVATRLLNCKLSHGDLFLLQQTKLFKIQLDYI